MTFSLNRGRFAVVEERRSSQTMPLRAHALTCDDARNAIHRAALLVADRAIASKTAARS